MNKPVLYDTYNQLTHRDGAELLDKFLHLVHWRPDGGDHRVLDVGCGTGNVTVNILLPRLPASVAHVLATDITPQMIEYARQHHQQQCARVTYAVLDIATVDSVPRAYHSHFDLVYSQFCLHWVMDTRRAMENIQGMLRAGGDVLLHYMADVPIFQVIRDLARRPWWREHTSTVLQTLPASSLSEAEMRALLLELGFEDVTCHTVPRAFTYDTFDIFFNLQMAVNPFIKDLPEALRARYLREYEAEIREQMRANQYTSDGGETGVHYRYTLIVVHARKPK